MKGRQNERKKKQNESKNMAKECMGHEQMGRQMGAHPLSIEIVDLLFPLKTKKSNGNKLDKNYQKTCRQ